MADDAVGQGSTSPDRIDGEITLAPAVETRFWTRLIIIWQHIKNVDLAGEPRLGCGRDVACAIHLFASGEQRCTIAKRPTVELHVRQLDSLGAERFRQVNYLRESIDVPPVNHEIEAQRNSGCANFRSDVELALMRTRAGDFVGQA